jgi:hypothetical protein
VISILLELRLGFRHSFTWSGHSACPECGGEVGAAELLGFPAAVVVLLI